MAAQRDLQARFWHARYLRQDGAPTLHRAHHYSYGLSPKFRRLITVCKQNRSEFFRVFPEMSESYVDVLYTGL